MRLRLTGPNGERREFDAYGKSRVDIGRTEDNDVAIASITVSRYHCRLVMPQGSKPVLEDLGSRYGTRVNNVPISGPTVLNEEDQFLIGSWLGQVLDIRSSDDASQQGQNPQSASARSPDGTTQELDLANTAEFVSSQENGSVWSLSHKILLGALGLIAVALIVYIFTSID